MSSIERLSAALADRYRIERELGAGGMATVYLAHDIKHDRKVALKVLKPELAAVIGAERFVVEIKTTAALQHPHILPLFDSGEADSFLYYVMPFIDGETLRTKLDRETQLGIEEAVQITRDVADALHYAHTRGVIHRDIKPENILLANGRPMVADFGIALALSAAAGGRMTETGLSLGTPHYMSPEQATAEKDISARSDIYSLASVLYEMLTGNPPHTGASAQQIIMKIVTEEAAPVTKLRKSVPVNVAAALAKALEKLPADRFESARLFGDALANPTFVLMTSAGVSLGADNERRKQRAAIPFALASLVLLGVAGWGWLRPKPEAPVMRFDLALGAATALPSSDVVISPDGSMLAFVGAVSAEPPAVYLRRIDGDPDFRKIPGTDAANATPTFSPDSRSIAFRRVGDGALLRVELSGGGVTTLARLGTALGTFLHWGTKDHIVYSGGPQGLYRIASTSGEPEFLPKTVGAQRYSFLLPDGSGVLFSTNDGIFVLDFKSDSATALVKGGTHPSYSETGHLLYVAENGGLFAHPFDLRTHRVVGPPLRVVDEVAAGTGRRGYSVSRNGALVYLNGSTSFTGGASVQNQLAMMDFAGRATPLQLPPGRRMSPRFSPDGKAIAFELRANRDDDTDIHTFDLATGTNTRITFADNNREPIWSPDGRRLVFSRPVPNSGDDLFIKSADNSGTERLLISLPLSQRPIAWPQEDTILVRTPGRGGSDVFNVSAKSGAVREPYLADPWVETQVEISPDRTLAAVTSTETGSAEIWIRDYPAPRGKWQVSTTGGVAPRWSPDGKHVYFWKRLAVSGDSLFRARVERTTGVVVHTPEFVLTAFVSDLRTPNSWDMHPDGKRFVVALPVPGPPSGAGPVGTAAAPASRYLVVLNWFTELRGKFAAKP